MTTFSTAPLGYDRDEVDAHVARLHTRLDEAITAMVALRAECDDLRTRVEQCGAGQPGTAPPSMTGRAVPNQVPQPPPVDPAVHPPLRPHPHPTRSADRARRRSAAGPVATALVWLVALVVAGLLLL